MELQNNQLRSENLKLKEIIDEENTRNSSNDN